MSRKQAQLIAREIGTKKSFRDELESLQKKPESTDEIRETATKNEAIFYELIEKEFLKIQEDLEHILQERMKELKGYYDFQQNYIKKHASKMIQYDILDIFSLGPPDDELREFIRKEFQRKPNGKTTTIFNHEKEEREQWYYKNGQFKDNNFSWLPYENLRVIYDSTANVLIASNLIQDPKARLKIAKKANKLCESINKNSQNHIRSQSTKRLLKMAAISLAFIGLGILGIVTIPFSGPLAALLVGAILTSSLGFGGLIMMIPKASSTRRDDLHSNQRGLKKINATLESNDEMDVAQKFLAEQKTHEKAHAKAHSKIHDKTHGIVHGIPYDKIHEKAHNKEKDSVLYLKKKHKNLDEKPDKKHGKIHSEKDSEKHTKHKKHHHRPHQELHHKKHLKHKDEKKQGQEGKTIDLDNKPEL